MRLKNINLITPNELELYFKTKTYQNNYEKNPIPFRICINNL